MVVEAGGSGPAVSSVNNIRQTWWVALQNAGKQHIVVSVSRTRLEVNRRSLLFKLSGLKVWKQRWLTDRRQPRYLGIDLCIFPPPSAAVSLAYARLHLSHRGK